MMSASKRTLISLILLALFAFALAAQAQEGSPAATALKFKKIKIPSQFEYIIGFRDFQPNNTKKGIALVDADIGDARQLHTLLLIRNGKTTLLGTLNNAFDNYPETAVVWLDGAAAPALQDALLFTGSADDDLTTVTVYLAKYNSNGSFTQQAVKIFEEAATAGNVEIDLYGLSAARGPASVAVAATLYMYNTDTRTGYVVGKFFETNFNGNLIGTIRDVPFNENVDQWATGLTPHWSGQMWLVPYRASTNNPDSCQCYMAKAYSATATAPADAPPITLTTIYEGGENEGISHETQFLLPQAAASAPGTDPAAAKLSYMHLKISNRLPQTEEKLVSWRYKSSVHRFLSAGKHKKKAYALPFENWDRADQAEAGWILLDYAERFSRFVPRTEGGYLVARGDMIRKRLQGSSPPAEYSYAGRVGLLEVDAKFKNVKEIVWYEFKQPEYSSSPPILSSVGNRHFILQQTRHPNQAETYFYISTYSY